MRGHQARIPQDVRSSGSNASTIAANERDIRVRCPSAARLCPMSKLNRRSWPQQAILVTALLSGAAPVSGQRPGRPARQPGPTFTANVGQWPDGVEACAKVGSGTAWFTENGMTVHLARLAEEQPIGAGSIGGPELQQQTTTTRLTFGGVARMPAPILEGSAGEGRRWVENVSGSPTTHAATTHEALRYPSVWPGIDAVFRGVDGQVAYEFELAGGVEAATIELVCEGLVEPLRVDADGNLVLTTELGSIRHTAPRTFEIDGDTSHVAVPSRFELRGDNRFGFAVDRIDPSRPLWIDPGINWSTYFGGVGNEVLWHTEHVGADLFVTAGLTRTALPAPWNTATPGNASGFAVALLDTSAGAAGSVWTTLINGSGTDVIFDTSYDPASGLITVVGVTDSPNFPVTANAWQPTFGGSYDGFITQLDLGGNIVYSTYVGGALEDRVVDVVHTGNQLTVIGATANPALPMAGNPWQPTHGGGMDAFIAQFDLSQPAGSQLAASTFVGDAGNQGIPFVPGTFIKSYDLMQLHVSAGGEVTVAINTVPAGLALGTSAGAHQTTPSGALETWVARFDPGLSTLVFATYFGGTGMDVPLCMDIDEAGMITLGLVTQSWGLPTTATAFSTTAGGSNDAFLMRLDPSQANGAQLVYGSYLGGADIDEPFDVTLEPSSGIATFVGQSRSAGFGIAATPGAFQATPQGTMAAQGFLLRVAMDGSSQSSLHYASYLTGPAGAFAAGVAQTPDGLFMISGVAFGTMPVLTGGPQATWGGGRDGFAALMDLLPNGVTPVGAATPACAPSAYMQVNSQPRSGNAGFELLCENAPPSTVGLIAIGTPLPAGTPVLGIQAYTLPLATLLMTSDANGAASYSLPVPQGAFGPYGWAAQYVWLTTTPCAGPGFYASNALTF